MLTEFPIFRDTHVHERRDGEWVLEVVEGERNGRWIPWGEERFASQFDHRGRVDNVNEVLDRVTGDVLGEFTTAPVGVRIAEDQVALGLDGDGGALTINQYPSGRVIRELDDMEKRGLAQSFDGANASTFSALEHDPFNRRLLAVGKSTGGVGAWDLDTWKFEVLFDTSEIVMLRVHPSGEFVVTGERDGSIQLRDPLTLEPTGEPLLGHLTAVGSFGSGLSFFDDRYLISFAADKTLRLWDLPTRQQLGDSLRSDGSFAFDAQPAASMVATATEDSILLWNYRIEEWPTIACRAAGRNMTRAEWEQFGPEGEPYHATCPNHPSIG